MNSIPRAAQAPLGKRDALAAALWVGAFTWEVIADRQKSAWREKKNKKEHDEQFITSGASSLLASRSFLADLLSQVSGASLATPSSSLVPCIKLLLNGSPRSYVGEVGLWSAQFLASTVALSSPLVAPIFPSWLAYAAVASPLAEYALIRYVSGVPILEVRIFARSTLRGG